VLEVGSVPSSPQTSAFLKLKPSWAQLGTWGCVIDDKGVCLHAKGQGINLTNGVFVVNSGKLIEYSPM